MSGQHSTPRGGQAISREEQVRLAKRLQSIEVHARALQAAIDEGFGGDLDPTRWKQAFESTDPHDVNRVMTITGDYSAIVNNLTELLKAVAGKRVLNLLPHRNPRAQETFDVVRGDGGLQKTQAEVLHFLYVLEGRIEHSSPDVTADEVLGAVEQIREDLPALMQSIEAWLDRHGLKPGASR